MEKTISPDLQYAFQFFMNDPEVCSTKMTRLGKAPKNLKPFQDRLVSFCTNSLRTKFPERVLVARPADAQNGVIERIVSKESMLHTLNYFEERHCLCVRICFGLDEDHNIQGVVAGCFYSPDGVPTPAQVDNPYLHKVKLGEEQGVFFLNYDYGHRIFAKRAYDYIRRFQTIASYSDLHGYVLDIATYKKILTDNDLMGLATDIRLRFGMNDTGDNPEVAAHSQVMMLELAPANGAPGAPIYLCAPSIKDDDDPTACPPRQPCSPPPPHN